MKPTLLLAMLSTAIATPGALAMTEFDLLQERCTIQEQQIRQLTAEIQKLRGTTTAQAKATTPAKSNSYTIRPGDSLEKIARRSSCSVETLAEINRLKLSATIHPGQKLKLPDTNNAIASNKSAPQKAKNSVSVKPYKIKEGDTYFSISKKQGISVDTLIAANPTVKATALRPGQMIHLAPEKTAAFADIGTTTMIANTKSPEASTAPRQPEAAPKSAPTPELPAAPISEKKIRSVSIEGEMSYGEFAAKHGTDIERLNSLNGLDLNTTTVLAKGSELYVPAQP